MKESSVGGSSAPSSDFQVNDIVFVEGNGSSPAKIAQISSDGLEVQIEWVGSKQTGWKTVFPVKHLEAARTERSSRRRKPSPKLLEQEASPPKKKIKQEVKKRSSHIAATEAKKPAAEKDDTAQEVEEPPHVPPTKPSSKKKKHPIPNLWEVTGVEENDEYILKKIAKLLPGGLKKCSKEVAHFFLFCYERQQAWERRNRGESKPYSQSLALKEYFFCNNYRELDRGTNYFRAHVLNLWEKHNKNGPVDHQEWIELVLFSSVCFRLVNRISTFEEWSSTFGIPELEEWPAFRKYMKENAGKKALFTDAHVCTGITRFLKFMDALTARKACNLKKASQLVYDALEDEKDCCLEKCFDAVRTLDGAGDFIAWQIVCDLMESQCLSSCTENDWVQLGPGAQSGIDIIFRGGKVEQFSYLELARTLEQVQDGVFEALGIEFPKWNFVPLTLKNIEHPLCEFSKYTSIHGDMRKRRGVMGQRRIKSRANMDEDKACHYVETCGVSEDILFCDKCLVGYCEGCAPRDSSSPYWVCHRCTEFEATCGRV